MKRVLLVCTLILLVGVGCKGNKGRAGVDGAQGPMGPPGEQGPAGVFVLLDSDVQRVKDLVLIELLEKEFTEVKFCLEERHGSKHGGEFKELRIQISPEQGFPCSANEEDGMCLGIFTYPNKIMIVEDKGAFKHEVIHYLHYKDGKGTDADHIGEDWESGCSQV